MPRGQMPQWNLRSGRRRPPLLGLSAAALWLLSATVPSDENARSDGRTAVPGPDARDARRVDSTAARRRTFDGEDALSGWKIDGQVAIEPLDERVRLADSRAGEAPGVPQGPGPQGRGSLAVGPGGKALLELRDQDASGTVDLWVYDDGTAPQDPKAHRVGPRWGLLQRDGKVLAVGILYASYLGGAEGYTATSSDGSSWFATLFWLGIRRAPARWRRWTFDFDSEDGLRILHDGKEVTAVDPSRTGLAGFSAIAIWGDDGGVGEGGAKAHAQVASAEGVRVEADRGRTPSGQTIRVADLSVTLGGPVEPLFAAEADPYDTKALEVTSGRTAVIYEADAPPPTPVLEELPLETTVSQYGITWTFEDPARVGRFVNGDPYVVGSVTIRAIDPKPLYGDEIARRELDRIDRERPEDQRVRNGFMLNPPAAMRVAYDSGVRNWFDPAFVRRLPVAMEPGDALVSTISMPKGLVLKAQLRNKIERGVGDSSPIRTAAVLTCLAEPQPPDAFRPAFTDRGQRIYLARNLKREIFPSVRPTPSSPRVETYLRFTQRPWVGTGFFGFEEPVENMPQYGLELGRVVGISALLLCTDIGAERKEALLVNLVQIGIDLGGMVRSGHPGWTAWGGHGSGRKLPIVLAGLLLGDEELAHLNRSFPKVSFGEDEQTAYGDAWTGAKVVFAGHSGIDAATGAGRDRVRGADWGPYEHLHPSEWKAGHETSEAYRRCCTSVGWVAQALALRLLGAEDAWGHDAFFDYVDRWMHEDDAAFVRTIRDATGKDHDKEWARQGQAWDAFVDEMWAHYRPTLDAPKDGWRKGRDAGPYRRAIETSRQPPGG